MYAVDIDTLYALELELLRYPGLELESIRDDAQVTHLYDDEEQGLVDLNLFARNMLLCVFRGPAVEPMGRPLALVPVAPDAVRDADMRSFLLSDAAEYMERLVEGALTR